MSLPRHRRSRSAAVAASLAAACLALSSCSAAGGQAKDGSAAAAAATPSVADDSADADPSEPASGPVTEERTVVPSRAARVGSVVAEAPVRIRLPGTAWLDVASVGTRPDGVLDVPDDVRQLGWWEGGARIGDPFGAVLMAGHVDSTTQGLGPSAVLLEVAEGDRVQVGTRSRTTTYAVSSRRLVAREELESYPDVVSSDGPARLVLVTCAPPFVASEDGYQNLAVVEAEPLPAASEGTGGRR